MQTNKQDQSSGLGKRKVRDFFYHLVVYLFLIILLLIVSGTSGAFIWIGLFWGFAVALHAVYAFFS